MNNDERDRILRLVAAGSITPAEAGDLLSALDEARSAPRPASHGASRAGMPAPTALLTGAPRSLVIQITEDREAKVNLRIPLGLVRAAGRFIPRQAQARLNDYNIDLDQLLHEMHTADGACTLIEIQDGADHVRIAVE